VAQPMMMLPSKGFSFSYDATIAQNLNILHYSGDPVEGAGAGFSDAANTLFNLYDAAPAPEGQLRFLRRFRG